MHHRDRNIHSQGFSMTNHRAPWPKPKANKLPFIVELLLWVSMLAVWIALFLYALRVSIHYFGA